MKKPITLLLALAIAFSLCACGGGGNAPAKEEPAVETEKPEQAFEKVYLEICDNLNTLNLNSKLVSSTWITVWDNMGADNVMTVIKLMLKIESQEDMDGITGIQKWMLAQALCPEYVSDGSATEEGVSFCLAACQAFNEAIAAKDEIDSSIKTAIKDLKDKCGEEYEDEIATLEEWYIESSLYADYKKRTGAITLPVLLLSSETSGSAGGGIP